MWLGLSNLLEASIEGVVHVTAMLAARKVPALVELSAFRKRLFLLDLLLARNWE
jgi:hydrogenase-4 membrane subunit HyfE